MMYSEYRPQPSALVELKAYSARARLTPCSTIESNCSSCPGRASCAVSVQATASKVKSSYLSSAPPLADGIFSGRTNSPRWPVLCRRGGGDMCGAGCCAVSAAVASRMIAGRSGSVTRFVLDDDLLDRRAGGSR